MRNFKELEIWEKRMEILRHAYNISEKLPERDRYSIRSKMIRSAMSMPTNVLRNKGGETSMCDSGGFLDVAINSSLELTNHLEQMEDLELVSHHDTEGIREKLLEEQHLLFSLKSSLLAVGA